MDEDIVSKQYLIKVSGQLALFTSPESRAEPVTYEVPTYGAARNLLQQIFWHPGMDWVVEKIYVCKPIKTMTIRTNSTNIVQSGASVLAKLDKTPAHIYTSEHRTQRTAMYLKDVEYVFAAHIVMRPQKIIAGELESSHGVFGVRDKYEKQFARRLRRGFGYTTPYLGRSECIARFGPFDGAECDIASIKMDKDFGMMFYDFDYSASPVHPMIRKTMMRHGIIDYEDENEAI